MHRFSILQFSLTFPDFWNCDSVSLPSKYSKIAYTRLVLIPWQNTFFSLQIWNLDFAQLPSQLKSQPKPNLNSDQPNYERNLFLISFSYFLRIPIFILYCNSFLAHVNFMPSKNLVGNAYYYPLILTVSTVTSLM